VLAAPVAGDLRVPLHVAGVVVLHRVHAPVGSPARRIERDIRELVFDGVQGPVDEGLRFLGARRGRELEESLYELLQADSPGDERLRHSLRGMILPKE
jgi:hypothetical protein